MISDKRTQWRSFAGGEVSEEMYGRVDLARHNIALKRCYNTVVTPQGVLENRAGSRFISETLDNAPAWLMPFVRSDGQGFLLEWGDASLRIVGGGNVLNEETDPGDTFTVSVVDIWVPGDGLPVTAALFTTSAPHGFVAGDAIRFQGFSLGNPDQPGNNTLASYMNVTWYIATAPTTTTFTISTSPTAPIDYTTLDGANLEFESGETGWTFSGSGSHAADATAPVLSGAQSLKLGVAGNPNDETLTATCDTLFPTVAGRTEVVTAQIRGTQSVSDLVSRLNMYIVWYDAGLAELSTTALDLDDTIDNGYERITSLGVHSHAIINTWEEFSIVEAAPANAAFYTVRFTAYWGDSTFTVDAVTVGIDGRATWETFSPEPYNGLVNGGTVALSTNTGPISLTPTYTQSHIRFAEYAQFVDDLVIAHKLYPVSKLTRVNDNDWTFTALSFNQTLAAPGSIAVTAQGTPGTPAITYTYTVTTVNDDLAESGEGTPDSDDNTLRTLGNFNDISWSAVGSAYRYNVYKSIGGSTYGYIGSSTDVSFTDDNISPDLTKRPPEVIADFNATGEYPGTVCFFDQRMVLGASADEPQAFFVSGLASFDYFKASVPPLDDQAFTYELMSRKSAPIIHSLADPELLFFTSAGVQRIVTVDGEVFSPTTVAARTASSFGAHELAKPQEAGTNVLYPVERGAHLYEMTPSDTVTGYGASDLSIIAAHLIDGHDWVQTAFRRAPFPIWFGLRDDGIIVALTYMPEQQVYAWHQHELPGAFIESIAVVPEGKIDSLYVIARRTINENTVRYIERIERRDFTEQAEAFFVDSGITYRGGFTNTVTGLDHLEGEEVMVLADGRVSGPYTVDSGEIEIDDLAEVIHVGLSYDSEVETLPLASAQEAGFGLGTMKNISQVRLRVKDSLGMTAGASFDDDDQRPMVDDAEEELGDTPALRTGVEDITPLGVWSNDTTVCIKQSQPLPMTITGLAADYTEG